MRWDGLGRMWVSCSTTYPHVYPGQVPNDKIVILEDVNGDEKGGLPAKCGRRPQCPTEFGDGESCFGRTLTTFLKDTNGNGKADLREIPLTGLVEDSTIPSRLAWTPDGDLIFKNRFSTILKLRLPMVPFDNKTAVGFRGT